MDSLEGFMADSYLSSNEMWTEPQSTFAQKTSISQLLLCQKLSKKPEAVHLNEFEDIVRKLRMEENEVLTQLFLTLPEEFDVYSRPFNTWMKAS